MKLLHSICTEYDDPKKTALICAESGASFTYEELSRVTGVLSRELFGIGVAKGKPALLIFPISLECVLSIFSVLAAGGIAAPIDRFMKNSALESLMDYMKPSVIITNEMMFHKLSEKILAKYPVVMVDAISQRSENIIKLSISNKSAQIESKEINYSKIQDDVSFQTKQIVPEDDALFITTSGTTGTPKIVRLNHKGVFENIRMHLESLGIEHQLIAIQTLELSYSYGLIASLLSTLYNKGTQILIPRLDIPFICDCISRYGANLWMGSPSLFRYLIDHCNPAIVDSLKSLKRITIGGDKCSPPLRSIIKQTLNHVEVNITYGITEAGPRVSTLPSKYFLEKQDSVGLPLAGVQLRLLKDDSKECDFGEVGHLLIKSPSIMSGYYGNNELTSQVIRDGWYHTGDLAKIDEEGFLFLMGRIDNQFKFNGRRINPKVIEDCILLYPRIIEARVSKIELDGSSYISADIISSDSSIILKELKRHCMKNLPMYMVPAKFNLVPNNEYYFKGKRVEKENWNNKLI